MALGFEAMRKPVAVSGRRTSFGAWLTRIMAGLGAFQRNAAEASRRLVDKPGEAKVLIVSFLGSKPSSSDEERLEPFFGHRLTP
jgi:hypothetical protein